MYSNEFSISVVVYFFIDLVVVNKREEEQNNGGNPTSFKLAHTGRAIFNDHGSTPTMASSEALRSYANSASWTDINNWYGPYKLLYYAPLDSRPFVPSRSTTSIFSKNRTVNFATVEANVWMGSLLVVAAYPWIRRKFYDRKEDERLQARYASKRGHWYGYNNFYFCREDPRAFVVRNKFVDTTTSSALWRFFQKKTTVNFCNIEANLWLCAIIALAFYPILRMENYDDENQIA